VRRVVQGSGRFARYVKRLLRLALLLVSVGLLAAFAQYQYHLFDRQLAALTGFVAEADSQLSNVAFAGISLGSLVLVLALCVFPIFMRKIDARAYRRGLWRGLVSALVFLVSTELYDFAERSSRLYLLGAIALVIVVSALLVEAVSLAVREENERSFRTDVVASIASGLLFSVLVKLGQYGLEWLKHLVARS